MVTVVLEVQLVKDLLQILDQMSVGVEKEYKYHQPLEILHKNLVLRDLHLVEIVTSGLLVVAVVHHILDIVLSLIMVVVAVVEEVLCMVHLPL